MSPRTEGAVAMILWAAILALSTAVGLAYEAWTGFLLFAGFCGLILGMGGR